MLSVLLLTNVFGKKPKKKLEYDKFSFCLFFSHRIIAKRINVRIEHSEFRDC